MSDKNPQHVLELHVKDTLCLKALHLQPDGKPVIIGGQNGSGKSAALQTIRMLLAGGREIPETVVRKGAKKSEARLATEDYVIRRTVGTDGRQTFELRAKSDGGKLKRPQTLLDSLRGRSVFDPLAFARAGQHEQLRIMRELAGVDTTDVDAKIAAAEESRAEATRQLRGVQSELQAAPYTAGVGATETSVTDLVATLEAARETNAANAAQRSELAAMRARAVVLADEIAAAEAALAAKRAEREQLTGDGRELAKVVSTLDDIDTDALVAELAAVEDTNKRARENARREELIRSADTLAGTHKRMEHAVEALRSERHDLVALADFPVDGLGFDDDGVTYNELPFASASRGEQMRVSAAIGIAEAKKHQLRVMLIDDADSLDDDNLRDVIAMALAAGVQPIVARRDGECTVILEDGEAITA